MRPEVVITDLELPGLGGGAVVALLRDASLGVPIIAMSGNTTLGPVALALGAAAFIAKPSRAYIMTACIELLCAA